MGATVGAVILFSSDLDACAQFYRLIGLDLEDERHEDGPAHLACDVDGVHVAIFEGGGHGRAPGHRDAGSTFVGFAVEDVDGTVDALMAMGVRVLQAPADFPWGRRAVVEDPDGRPVELFERPPE
jgi:lactoylglutathione lyase